MLTARQIRGDLFLIDAIYRAIVIYLSWLVTFSISFSLYFFTQRFTVLRNNDISKMSNLVIYFFKKYGDPDLRTAL